MPFSINRCTMKFETYSYTNTGGCIPNEDASAYCSDDFRCLWVLCDGLGGHADGEQASNSAVDTMLEKFSSGSLQEHQDLSPIIEQVNQIVRSLCGPLTTIVTAYYKNGAISIANVGDSRLYFFRNHKLVSVTTDHSVAFADYYMQKIKYGDIRFHPDHSSLMKALGIKSPSVFNVILLFRFFREMLFCYVPMAFGNMFLNLKWKLT